MKSLKKHQAFEAEIMANADRIRAIKQVDRHVLMCVDCRPWQHLRPTYRTDSLHTTQLMQVYADVRLRAGSPPQLLPLIQTRWLLFWGTWCRWATPKTLSEPYIRRFADCPRTGSASQDVHVTPGFGPSKQTFIRSTQHGDLPRTENDGSNSWKRPRSSQGLARDDDDESVYNTESTLIRSVLQSSPATLDMKKL